MTLPSYLLCWILKFAKGHRDECCQVYMVAEILGHLEMFIQIFYLELSARSSRMPLGQVSHDLLAAMELANVPFSVVFIDPWVDDLACSVFHLNLQGDKLSLVTDKCLEGEWYPFPTLHVV